jgi:hypothetical protein
LFLKDSLEAFLIFDLVSSEYDSSFEFSFGRLEFAVFFVAKLREIAEVISFAFLFAAGDDVAEFFNAGEIPRSFCCKFVPFKLNCLLSCWGVSNL